MKQYLNSDELIKTVMLKVAAGALLDCSKNLKRVLSEKACADLEQMGEAAIQMHVDCLNACEDEDQAEFARRRANKMKIGVGYVKPAVNTTIDLDLKEASNLCGLVLSYFCELECPCVTMDDDGGRTVNRAAVKGCELRKLFRRIGLAQPDVACGECPYSMYL